MVERIQRGSETHYLSYISSPEGLVAMHISDDDGRDEMKYVLTDYLGTIYALVDDGAQSTDDALYYSFNAWGERRELQAYDGSLTAPLFSDPADYITSRGYTGHEHIDAFDLINMNGRAYDPVVGAFLSPDPYVQAPDMPQNLNRYAYCLNNPLIYTDPSGEIFWTPIIIGAVLGTYMGGAIANDGNLNPFEWEYFSIKTWGYMLGGAVVGGLSGYVGGAIAAAEIPMANTLGIAGASLTNSVGTYVYTGGQTDISMSFGVASYNFTQGEWGYLGKSGNSIMQDIGYGLGAVANVADLYKFTTWDILSPKQKTSKLQKITSDQTISYDPDRQATAQYDPNTDNIVFSKDGLRRGLGWAKSSYEHEALHRADFTTQPSIPSHISSQTDYYAFLDSRAYNLELSKSFQNSLSYKQHIWLQQKYIHYSNVAGISPGTTPNYTFLQWLRSLLSR